VNPVPVRVHGHQWPRRAQSASPAGQASLACTLCLHPSRAVPCCADSYTCILHTRRSCARMPQGACQRYHTCKEGPDTHLKLRAAASCETCQVWKALVCPRVVLSGLMNPEHTSVHRVAIPCIAQSATPELKLSHHGIVVPLWDRGATGPWLALLQALAAFASTPALRHARAPHGNVAASTGGAGNVAKTWCDTYCM
jgi:hypothetical protein